MPTDVQPMYDRLKEAIDEIDEKLDSLDDSASAGKRKIINDLVDQYKSTWEQPANQVVTGLSNLDEETLVGVYNGIINALNSAFRAKTDEYLTQKIESQPKTEPLITEEEAKELSEARSQLYQQIKVVVQLAADMDNVTLEMPKTRRGGRGRRGKRVLNQMIWSVNGNELPKETTYKELAELLGFEPFTETRNKRDGSTEEVSVAATAALTRFLKSKGVDVKNPENGQISVTLNDGRLLEGYVPEEDDGDEDEVEEEEEETSDDE